MTALSEQNRALIERLFDASTVASAAHEFKGWHPDGLNALLDAARTEGAAAQAVNAELVEALLKIARAANWPSGAKRNDLALILSGVRRDAIAAIALNPAQPPGKEGDDA